MVPCIQNSGLGKCLCHDPNQIRGCFGVALPENGHKGTLWSDESVLSWVHPMRSPPCLLFESNRSIFCPQTPSLPFRLMPFPLPGKLLLSQSLQAQRLSVPKELVTIPPPPRSPLCSPLPSATDSFLSAGACSLGFGPKYSVCLLAASYIPDRL